MNHAKILCHIFAPFKRSFHSSRFTRFPTKSPRAPVPCSGDNVPEFIFKEAVKHGDLIALENFSNGQKFSFNELVEYSRCVASSFSYLGVRHGDVVATVTPNRGEYVLAALGANLIGATIAPLNPMGGPDEISKLLKHCKAKLLLVDKICKPLVDKMEPVSSIEKIVYFTDEHPRDSSVSSNSFAHLMQFSPESYARVLIDVEKDTGYLYPSSGTSGMPKLVRNSQFSVTAMVDMLIACGNEEVLQHPGDCMHGMLPFFHIFGGVMLYQWIKRGATTVCVPSFDRKSYLQLIQERQIKHLYVAPPIVVFLAKDPIVSDYDLSSVKYITCGAAPLSKELSQDLVKRLTTIEYVLQGYGMTEVTCAATYTPTVHHTEIKFGSCGTLLPNYEGKIVNPETEEELGVNETGEIYVRSPTVMQGYLNNEEETNEMLMKDGWLKSGDIGHYDEEGWFFVTDRLKELIKVKGFQVAPAELEGLLFKHPAVADVAVIGIADAKHGEVPKAFVVKRPNCNDSEQEIAAFIESQVSSYKKLLGGVEFVSEIPKSRTGKILRRLLR